MNPLHTNPTRRVLINSAAAVSAVVVFFGVLHIADTEAEPASQQATIGAQAQAQDQRLQRAARALCQAEAGPSAQALWTVDGDLVCRPALITAQGAQP